MTFNIALSGLNAASADLQVTGNNIANSSTTGFKGSRPEFADVFAQSFGGVSSNAIGGGVRLGGVQQQFTQGTIDSTGNNLDLAINGQGFFALSDAGTRVYSRAGAFQVDKDGFVANAQNQRLQVFPSLDAEGSRFNTASPSDLQLDSGEGPPKATTSVEALLNLQSDAVDLGAGAIDPAVAESFNYSTSATVYDSLGAEHTSSLYFRKTGANQWDVSNYIDGSVATTGGGNPTAGITFNADGSIASGGTIAYDGFDPGNGAEPLALTTDLTGATQFGSGFNVGNLAQDGFATGRLSNIAIDDGGVISARFTNGQSQALGKVALANFPNPQGLQQLGDNAWGATFDAGAVQLGEPGSGSFGNIQSGGLEASNVDIAAQLVNLITAQRNYQANAQVVTTADTITQTIINI